MGGFVGGEHQTPTHTGSLPLELLDTVGAEVFGLAVSQGWLAEHDDSFGPGTPYRTARDLLTDLGLLRYDEAGRRFVPVDPATISEGLLLPRIHRASEMLSEAARLNAAVTDLGQAYQASSRLSLTSISEIHGIEAINAFIDTQLADCRSSFLCAQPYGKRPAVSLEKAEQRDLQALARGVTMRTLYQHSARYNVGTRAYVEELSASGAEVRTLDEFFKRLLIFDRRVALIPATENHVVAIAIRDKSVVAFLVDIFERAWERGQPFALTGEVAARAVAGDVRAMAVRMLVEGHSDSVSAKRMGVSTRTFAAYIAALKQEYNVQTRFQLGWAMSQGENGTGQSPLEELDAIGHGLEASF